MTDNKRILFTAVYFFLAVFLIFQIFSQRRILKRIETDKKNQEILLKEKEEENKALKDILEKMNTGEFIEKEARERFNMIKEGEIPVKDGTPQ